MRRASLQIAESFRSAEFARRAEAAYQEEIQWHRHGFFSSAEEYRNAFREKYHLREDEKAVIFVFLPRLPCCGFSEGIDNKLKDVLSSI